MTLWTRLWVLSKTCHMMSLLETTKTVFAVVRVLEIVGEAVKKIPQSIRKNYPEIPWKDMAGMRDKVVHEYFGVKLERVWETIQSDIPSIKPLFEKIRKDLGE